MKKGLPEPPVRPSLAEAMYAKAFAINPAAIGIVRHSNGLIIDVNESWQEMFRYNREEAIGKSAVDLCLWPMNEDRSRFLAELHRKGSLRDREYTVSRKSGESFVALCSAELMTLAGEELIVSTWLDITGRKRAEQALEQSERNYREIFDNVTDAIFIHDAETGEILDGNRSMLRMFGIDRNQANGLTLASVYPGVSPYSETDARQWLKRARTEGPQVFEWHARRTNGTVFWVEVSLKSSEINGQKRILALVRDIEDRKRAEAELHKKEHLLSESQRAGHIGSWSRDLGTEHIQWSDETYRIYGLTPGSFNPTSESFISRIHPDDRPLMKEFIRNCAAGESTQVIEFRCIHPDRTSRILYARGELQRAADGTPLRITGTVQDITEQKRAERELQASEEKYRIVAENTFDWEFWLNPQGRFLYCSPSCERITGHKASKFLEDPFLLDRIMHPDDREQFLNHTRKACSQHHQAEIEFRILRPDGAERWIAHICHAIFDNDRKFLGMRGSNRDITERKQTENALSRSQKNLAEAQRQTHIGSFEFDFRSERLEWSEEMFRICGVMRESFRGTMKDFLDRVHPEDLTKVEKIREEGLTKPGPLHLEFRIVRPKADVRFVRMTFETTFREDGSPLRRIGTFQDITEARQTEEEKNKLESQLQHAQKMESIGRLAGGVAHDFNNMLGVILGHTELALEQVDKTQPLHADLKQIQNAAKHSADLTRQLLAFARKQTVDPKVLDLNETVSGVARMLQRLIGENITMEWKPGKNLWPVKIDPSQIDQILANLAVNARDAIEGMGTLTIATANAMLDESYCSSHAGCGPGDYVRLAIGDTGAGMDSGTLAHIFEPFFTTKEVGKGTGLGLATVYGIVRQNNGYIDVISRPGQGTRFEIYLPANFDNAAKVPAESVDRMGCGQETILLVEDEPAILKLTQRILEKQGYLVLAAPTPNEAIRLAREKSGKIDILMTDVIMPEMTGRDLAASLQSLYPQLECLFVSGYTADVIAQQGVLTPNTYFLQKPFSIKELNGMLEKLRRPA